MKTAIASAHTRFRGKKFSLTAALLALVLFCQPTFILVADGQGKTQPSQRAAKKTMSADQRVAHVLSRLTFGARPGDFERVRAMGVDTFINQQLDPDSFDAGPVSARLRRLPTLGMATPVIIEQYTPPKPAAGPSLVAAKASDNTAARAPNLLTQNSEKTEVGKVPAIPAAMPNEMQMDAKKDDAARMQIKTTEITDAGRMPALPATPKPTPPPKNPQMVVTELQRAKLLRAVYSERQLYELLVDFWENHFNIYANKDNDRYLLTSYDRDTIRPFAMGRFRDLLGATAHSPAMLFYLDNWRSSVRRPYPATKDKPAGADGGLNENYARELMELHTLGVDGGYTQQDVQEVARCFTGWTIQKPNEQGLFLYRPGLHDDGEKTVLGHKILAGGGIADGERVLDILATHPATARFIATKMARRFISDEPPQSVIDRATTVFLKTDGSIRETLRSIITSPEFFSTATYRAKMRSPFEYVAAAMRAKGYLQAQLGKPRQEQTESSSRTIVSVNEGALFRLGEVKIDGSRTLSPTQIREMFELRTGDIANGDSIGVWLFERVKKAYGNLGYIQYTVEVQPTFHRKDDAREGVADLAVSIDEGNAFTIASIQFVGNENVSRDVLLREMTVRKGEVFSQELLDESLMRINQNGQFETIDADRDVDYGVDQKAPRISLTIHLKKRVAESAPLPRAIGRVISIQPYR